MSNTEHPVWNILNKDKYSEEFYSQAEAMYAFIKSIVSMCGSITEEGNTVPVMRKFYDMWNEQGDETFQILRSLVNSGTTIQEHKPSFDRMEDIATEALQGLVRDDPISAEEFFDKVLELTAEEREYFGINNMSLF